MSDKCRICRESTPNGKFLFEEEQTDCILHVVLLTDEWLNDTKGWPSLICKRCEDELRVAAAFRERCIHTQNQLRREQNEADNKPAAHLGQYNYGQGSRVRRLGSRVLFDDELFDEESTSSSESESDSVESGTTVDNNFKQPDMQEGQEEAVLQEQLESDEEKEDENSQEETDSNRKIDKPKLISVLSPVEKAKKIFKRYDCNRCDKHFSNLNFFKQHVVRHTDKTSECEKCGKLFISKQELRLHDLCHTRIKHYTCRFCYMAFHSCGSRLGHERRIHTSNRPYKCRYCEKTFLNSKMCKRHEAIHPTVGMYYCTLCNTYFKTYGYIKQSERKLRHKVIKELNKNLH